LAEIVTPDALASAQAIPPDVAAQHVAVRTAMADCDLRIKRLLESIESEIDHELVAPRVRQLQAERSRLEAAAGVHDQWRRLSAREIAEWADSLGGLVQVLKRANPEDRAALYAEFGLTLRYDPTRHQIKATAELSRVGRGVGGPTPDSNLRSTPPRGG
jgi:SOS-response transcriptional repressor LexA